MQYLSITVLIYIYLIYAVPFNHCPYLYLSNLCTWEILQFCFIPGYFKNTDFFKIPTSLQPNVLDLSIDSEVPPGCKQIGIPEFKFSARTQFLYSHTYILYSHTYILYFSSFLLITPEIYESNFHLHFPNPS